MPTLVVSSGITNVIGTFSDGLDAAFLDGTVTAASATQVSITTASGTVVVDGMNFAPDGFGGFTGTMTDALFTYTSGETITLSNLNLDLGALTTAYALEDAGVDLGAVEAILFPLDWTVISNDNADFLPEGATSSDGIPINLSGNNRFELNGGEDYFFAGDGDDTVFGGTDDDDLFGGLGNDVIRGGKQRDEIFGNEGKDNLFGGKGKDYISGDEGNDRLRGDIGNDTLEGGASRDKMTGGDGIDQFWFNVDGNTRTGADTITDFNAAEDSLRFFNANPADVVVSEAGGDVIVTHEGGSILLEGVTDVSAVEDSLTFSLLLL